MNSSLRIVAVVLGIVVVLLVAAVGIFVWVKFAGLKTELAHNLGKALNAKVEVNSLDLNIWNQEIHAAGISLENERIGASWEKGTIAQAVVHFHFSEVFSPPPHAVERRGFPMERRPAACRPGGRDRGYARLPFLPVRVIVGRLLPRRRQSVTSLTATEGDVTYELALDRKMELRGVSFESSDNGAGLLDDRSPRHHLSPRDRSRPAPTRSPHPGRQGPDHFFQPANAVRHRNPRRGRHHRPRRQARHPSRPEIDQCIARCKCWSA